MSDLARVFREAADKHQLSNREIAKKSGVSSPTVDRMMNGTVQAKPENIDAVARVLGVPLAEVRRLTGLPADLGAYVPTSESRLLDQRQRRALDELIRSIVATQGATHGLEIATQQDASSQAGEDQKSELTTVGKRISSQVRARTDDVTQGREVPRLQRLLTPGEMTADQLAALTDEQLRTLGNTDGAWAEYVRVTHPELLGTLDEFDDEEADRFIRVYDAFNGVGRQWLRSLELFDQPDLPTAPAVKKLADTVVTGLADNVAAFIQFQDNNADADQVVRSLAASWRTVAEAYLDRAKELREVLVARIDPDVFDSAAAEAAHVVEREWQRIGSQTPQITGRVDRILPEAYDDAPPPIELADAARTEPGHVKQGDRVKHLDEDGLED